MIFAGLILASGKSSRFGSPKAFYELDGKSLLCRWIAAFEQCGVQNTYVTIPTSQTNHATEHVRSNDLPLPKFLELYCSEQPQGYSFVHALQEILVGPPLDYLIFTPVDVIAPTPDDLRALLGGVNNFPAVKPYDQSKKRGGHPVLLSRALCEKFASMDAESFRLDNELKALGTQVRLFDTNSSSFFSNMNHQPLL